jgi:hypothetical protein
MSRVLALAVLLGATLPAAAPAQTVLGLRAGLGVPWGELTRSAAVADSLESMVPITLDLGIRLGPALVAGAYASYGVARPSKVWQEGCDLTSARCTAADLRIGAQLQLHADGGASGFWGGFGLGYEELRTRNADGFVTELTFKGYDATLQCGFDFRASQALRIGPWLAATAGHFSAVTSGSERTLGSRALHGWLQAGLRAELTL